jgi:hypothetical protein
MFARRRDANRGRAGGARVGSSQSERRPVDILGQQMAVAKLARASGDWPAYEQARDNAFRLVLSHRIEDEVSRFRQVMTACFGWQDRGDDARELIMRRLTDAFMRGVERGESAHDVIVRMHRIPRAGATAALVSEMSRGDGEVCISFLLCEEGHVADDDVRSAFGDDPAQIATRLTDRDWADFVSPLLAVSPREPRDEVTAAARKALRRTLLELRPK